MRLKPTLFFVLRFTIVFIAIVAPWPGWYQAYGEAFRKLAGKCLRHPGGGALVKFTRQPPAGDKLDLTAYLTNASMVGRKGDAPATWVKLNSRVLGLIPTGVLVALIGASPVSWGRRALALGWGMIGCHAYILGALWLTIVHQAQSVDLGLHIFEWSSFGRAAVKSLHQIFVEHIGTQLAFTVVFWVLVTFTREDWRRWAQWITEAAKPRGKAAVR